MSKTKTKKERLVRSECLAVGSLVTITLLSGIILASTKASADTDATDTITVTLDSSCSLTGTNTAHTGTITNGIATSNIGETTLKATCNDASGFAIYAIGYTGDTDGNNKLVNSTLGSTADIATGTNTTGNSSWAMKVTTETDPAPDYPITIMDGYDAAAYHTVPDDYAMVAKRTTATDAGTNATGSILKTTYQVYASNTQPAGTYTGKVKYVLVHPNEAAAPQTPLGLCTNADTCMQQQTAASLAQKLPNVGSTTTLYDARDNQAYTVAKLADGKYWMTENLNLAGGTALSAADTDVTSAYISSFSTSNNLTKTNDTIVLPASATKNDADNNLTDNTQFSQNNYSYVFNSGNKTNCGASGQNTPCFSYYSWDAVTLGSGRTISTDNTDAEQSICPKNWKLPTSRYSSTFDTTTAAGSDFYNLATNYGMSTGAYSQSTANFNTQAGPGTTPNFLLADTYYSGHFAAAGFGGYYWSSTSASDIDSAYGLFFDSYGSVYSSYYLGRVLGFSVRCLYGS